MSDQVSIESILGVDVGSTFTHVCLIDLVEGTYRLVAHAGSPSTLREPENDLTIGLLRAVKRVEYIAQRPLLDVEDELVIPEHPTGAGVDAVVATSSAAPPLRCVVVGLTDDLSLESAQRACSGANVVVTRTISLSQRARRWDRQTVASLYQAPPDVVLLVGGVDTGPVAPLESAARVLVTIYSDFEAERRPVVVFAGNQEARRRVSAIISPVFELRVVDNVRPSVQVESLGELQRELTELYQRIKLPTLPGYERLQRWCVAPVRATSEALGVTLRFIARRNNLDHGILGIDVGGANTYIGAVQGDLCRWVLGTELGTSSGIGQVVELSGIANVRRWLPMFMHNEEALQHLENARLRPHSLAQSTGDVHLLQAVAHQALVLTMRRMREQHWLRPGARLEEDVTSTFDLIAARGGAFTHAPGDGLAALTLLDALQPVGLTRLVVDWASMWPQLGALARIVPLAAAQVLERDGFHELGTVIAPIGEARDGEYAMRLVIVRDDGQVTQAEIPAGTVRRFPLEPDEYATIEAHPARPFDIGLGRKGVSGRVSVHGGSLGIIVDTRGRPLVLSEDPRQRREKLQQWMRNLDGDVTSSP